MPKIEPDIIRCDECGLLYFKFTMCWTLSGWLCMECYKTYTSIDEFEYALKDFKASMNQFIQQVKRGL